MPGLDVKNVPLGGGPVEGETGQNTSKGEGSLTVGQPHHIHRHLKNK